MSLVIDTMNLKKYGKSPIILLLGEDISFYIFKNNRANYMFVSDWSR